MINYSIWVELNTCKCGRVFTVSNEETCPDCSEYVEIKEGSGIVSGIDTSDFRKGELVYFDPGSDTLLKATIGISISPAQRMRVDGFVHRGPHE